MCYNETGEGFYYLFYKTLNYICYNKTGEGFYYLLYKKPYTTSVIMIGLQMKIFIINSIKP